MSSRNPSFRLLRQLVTAYVFGLGLSFLAVDSAVEAGQKEALRPVQEKLARATASTLLVDAEALATEDAAQRWMATMRKQEPSIAFVRIRTENGTLSAGDAEEAYAFATVDNATGAVSAEVGLRPQPVSAFVPRLLLVSVFLTGLFLLLRWTANVRSRMQALADLARRPVVLERDEPVFAGNDEFGWLGRRIVSGMDMYENAANDGGAAANDSGAGTGKIRRVA